MSEASPELEHANGDDPISTLHRAATAHAEADDRVTEVGESTLRTVADAHERATGLLDTYDGRATGTGDFGAFVEFEEEFSDLVAGLPEDLPRRECFERADDRLDKRRLNESDFSAARETLAPAADLADRLEERADARERHRDALRAVRSRRDTLDARIEELQRLSALGGIDLDAPVAELREPLETYNHAVRDAFEAFRGEESARTVVAFLETARVYPLVALRAPPPDLAEYVASNPAGTESLDTLIEYADYSISKLDHYVEEPHELKRRIAVHRSYLDRLDAAPLEIEWPPPPADELRWRIRELVSVVGRFATPEVVAKLRAVRALAREERYERLRETARAREELSSEERKRLADGSLDADLDSAREERERFQRALDEDSGV